MMGPQVLTVQGRRFGRRQYQKYYHGKNTKQTMDCLLHRYAKEPKFLDDAFVNEHIKGFNRFVKADWIKYARKQVTPEIINESVTDYIRELQKKFPKDDLSTYYADIDHNYKTECMLSILQKKKASDLKNIIRAMMEGKESKLTELEREWNDSFHMVVSFHMKRQPKEVRDYGYDAKFKAGQGISAWTKLMNVVFSAFTRTYDKLIKDYVLPNVQISYGDSDATMAEF